MRAFPTLIILSCLLFSCGNSGEQNDAASVPAQASRSGGELRSAYQLQLSEIPDPMPQRQIVEPGKLYPVDEALGDTLFFVFREELLDAVRDKDILQLISHVSESLEGPEGDAGLEAFTERWSLNTEESIQTSELWGTLEQTLTQGGAFDASGSKFLAPFAFATFPRDTYDPSVFGAVTGSGVRLRGSASLGGSILSLVSNDIVPVLEVGSEKVSIGDESYPWVKIRDLSEHEGYIWGKFVWYPSQFHAIFSRENGEWELTTFAPGN